MFTMLFIAALSALVAEVFAYKQEPGDKWRIISSVTEDIYINGKFSHHSDIVERTASEVTGAASSGALIKAVFQSAEKARNPDGSERFTWGEDYEAAFMRSSQGRLEIRSTFFRPSTRNVPTFPATDVRIGQTWQAPGTEVHDLRESLGLSAPYTIPFMARYEYLGSREWKGKRYPAFSIDWDLEYLPPKSSTRRPKENPPSVIRENAKQILYWDNDAGREAAAETKFTLSFLFSDRTEIEFRGTGISEIVESERLNRDIAAQEAVEAIEKLAIPDTTVKITPEGITLSLDNIQFEPDSGRLLATEKVKLDKIAEVLARFDGRDLLIGGHTALAGDKASRDKLSLERAEAVAAYLRSIGARDAGSIVTRGYGSDRPLAPNTSEEGRRQNRRVEITILEN